MSSPRFIGSHGEDWCARPGQLGPPDRINGDGAMHWLIVPGPPLSCYMTFVPPHENTMGGNFYHMHPETWTLNIVLSGHGKHYVEGKEHDLGPGSVIYQGPGVRHSTFSVPGQSLTFISIQHPSAGHSQKEWVACPDAGTVERFGDLQAFIERFGSPEASDFLKGMTHGLVHTSERWNQYVLKQRST